MNDDWLQKVTGAHRTTIARWRALGSLPPELVRLAKLELVGEIGLINDAWLGWRIDAKTGQLISPGETFAYTPGEICALNLRLQQLAELDRDNSRLRQSTSDVESMRLQKRLRKLLAELDHVAWEVGKLRQSVDPEQPGLSVVGAE